MLRGISGYGLGQEVVPQASDESIERTWRACAWLVSIAERCVETNGLDPVVVAWLEKLGSNCYERLGCPDGQSH